MNGTWSTVAIGGKPADVYAPATSARPRFGILHLHDEDQQTLKDQPVFTRLFEESNLACICPHGDHSWWTDRRCEGFDPHETAEHFLLNRVVPWFAEQWNLLPRAIG